MTDTLTPGTLTPDEADARAAALTSALDWHGPTYRISAATGDGTRELVRDLMVRLETLAAAGQSTAP